MLVKRKMLWPGGFCIFITANNYTAINSGFLPIKIDVQEERPTGDVIGFTLSIDII